MKLNWDKTANEMTSNYWVHSEIYVDKIKVIHIRKIICSKLNIHLNIIIQAWINRIEILFINIGYT